MRHHIRHYMSGCWYCGLNNTAINSWGETSRFNSWSGSYEATFKTSIIQHRATLLLAEGNSCKDQALKKVRSLSPHQSLKSSNCQRFTLNSYELCMKKYEEE